MKPIIRSALAAVFASVLVTLPGIAAADEAEDNLRQNLGRLLPDNLSIDSIEASPMENVYLVTTGAQTLYVYSKDDFIMVGDVYDTARMVNIGEERKSQQMARALESIPKSEMILMSEDLERYVVVFTDTDCGYCQRFHQTVPELEARGMQVRYLMFPRAGIGSASYNEMVSVWCAEDPARAMTIAKSGGVVDPAECDNPVADQYQLGQKLGVRGTPTLILDNGKVIPGFLTPDQLMAEAGAN